jgi:hypothetical protein
VESTTVKAAQNEPFGYLVEQLPTLGVALSNPGWEDLTIKGRSSLLPYSGWNFGA